MMIRLVLDHINWARTSFSLTLSSTLVSSTLSLMLISLTTDMVSWSGDVRCELFHDLSTTAEKHDNTSESAAATTGHIFSLPVIILTLNYNNTVIIIIITPAAICSMIIITSLLYNIKLISASDVSVKPSLSVTRYWRLNLVSSLIPVVAYYYQSLTNHDSLSPASSRSTNSCENNQINQQ